MVPEGEEKGGGYLRDTGISFLGYLRLIRLQIGQDHDHPLCRTYPVRAAGQIYLEPDHRGTGERMYRRGADEHRRGGHHVAGGVDRRGSVYGDGLLPGVDREENQGFRGVEPPAVTEPGAHLGAAVGVRGAVL